MKLAAHRDRKHWHRKRRRSDRAFLLIMRHLHWYLNQRCLAGLLGHALDEIDLSVNGLEIIPQPKYCPDHPTILLTVEHVYALHRLPYLAWNTRYKAMLEAFPEATKYREFERFRETLDIIMPFEDDND